MFVTADDLEGLNPCKMGEKLKQQRKRKGLSQSRLAIEARVDIASLSRCERGINGLSLKHFFSVASVLGMSADELMREVLKAGEVKANA